MTAPMVAIEKRYRYLVEDVDRHGNVRLYFRRNGVKVRVREHLGSVDFEHRYAQLVSGNVARELNADRRPQANTLRWLAVQFFGSADYKRLDPRTQYTRRRIIESMLLEPPHRARMKPSQTSRLIA